MFRHRIIRGNPFYVLNQVEDNSVDMIFTFLPTFGSNYCPEPMKTDDVKQYVLAIDAMVRYDFERVLKKEGSLYLGVKDLRSQEGSMMMIPREVSEKLVTRGWYLRNRIIVCGQSPLELYTSLWFFTRSRKYHFNLDSIREPHTSLKDIGRSRQDTAIPKHDAALDTNLNPGGYLVQHKLGKNAGDCTVNWYSVNSVREPITIETLKRYQRAVNLGRTSVRGKWYQNPREQPYPMRAPKAFRDLFGPEPNYKGKFESIVVQGVTENFGSPHAHVEREGYDIYGQDDYLVGRTPDDILPLVTSPSKACNGDSSREKTIHTYRVIEIGRIEQQEKFVQDNMVFRKISEKLLARKAHLIEDALGSEVISELAKASLGGKSSPLDSKIISALAIPQNPPHHAARTRPSDISKVSLGETAGHHVVGKNPSDLLHLKTVVDPTRPKANGHMVKGGMMPPPNVHKTNPDRVWNPKGKQPSDIEVYGSSLDWRSIIEETDRPLNPPDGVSLAGGNTGLRRGQVSTVGRNPGDVVERKTTFNLRVRDVKSGKRGLYASGGGVKELDASEQEVEQYNEVWIPDPIGKHPDDIIDEGRKQPPSSHSIKRWERGKNVWEERFHPTGKNPSDVQTSTDSLVKQRVMPQFAPHRGNRDEKDPDTHAERIAHNLSTHYTHPIGKNPRDVDIIDDVLLLQPEVAVKPILSSCPPLGVVLDPFAGVGTIAYVADTLYRRSISIEMDGKNITIIKQRLGLI